ncbi:hypothetical protein A5777_18810 [Gordonia sp. 852002-10350_SCH5691597]|nr:hypothetical protein A5766_16595 [Gordonia sp. 852002-51296_SCH5728562-b]OBA66025.1 hypothetical protein A5777_18810 [Gordonia sp. 852002-10350_SCH5691597]
MTGPQDNLPSDRDGRNEGESTGSPSPSEPSEFRRAMTSVVITVLFTVAIVLVAAASSDGLQTLLLVVAPIVVLIAALSTAVRTYRVWRAAGRWQIWQGAMWFEFAFFVIVLFGTAPLLLAD